VVTFISNSPDCHTLCMLQYHYVTHSSNVIRSVSHTLVLIFSLSVTAEPEARCDGDDSSRPGTRWRKNAQDIQPWPLQTRPTVPRDRSDHKQRYCEFFPSPWSDWPSSCMDYLSPSKHWLHRWYEGDGDEELASQGLLPGNVMECQIKSSNTFSLFPLWFMIYL